MNAVENALRIASKPIIRRADGGAANASLTPDLDQFINQASAAPASSSTPQPSANLTPDLDKFISQAAPPTTSQAPQGPQDFSRMSNAIRNAPATATANAGIGSALGRIGSAAAQGAEDAWGNAPILPMVPGTGAAQFGKQLISNIGAVPLTAMRGAGALMGAAQGAVAQTGAELGQPQLGRDIAAMPEAFMGDAGWMNAPEEAEATAERAPAAATDYKPLPESVVPTAATPQGVNVVGTPEWVYSRLKSTSPTPTAATPQSVGAAATPSHLAQMTPKEVAATEASDNLRRLSQGPTPGDDTIYIPGSRPTAADIAGDAQTSLEEKQYRQTIAPGEFDARDAANNEARVNHFQDLAGNPNVVQTMKDERENQANIDLANAWKNKGQADAAPIIDHARDILSGPAGKDDAVVNSVNRVVKKLLDENGDLETDPEMLYGVRKSINTMLSNFNGNVDRDAQAASSQLLSIRSAIDKQIEAAAPGFKQYLQNYSDASRPIDAMNYLQKWQNRIINSSGRMSTPQVHAMMRDITKNRAMPGVNDAKSIDPDTLSKLWDLHSDMIRMNHRNLGRAIGSDTYQNFSLGQQVAGKAAHAVAHGIAAHVAPGVGNIAIESAKGLLKNRANAKLLQQQAVRKNQLLNPDIQGNP